MLTRVKEFRKQKGWRQIDLAIAANVAPSTVYNAEQGYCREKSRERIANALEKDVDLVFPHEGEK